MLVQMSGIPGTGKSTLARALGNKLGLIVLDTDVVKSALLNRGVPIESAGSATYAVTLELAGDLLAQGHAVIVDSPCRYRELLEAGQQIALDAGVRYRFIELWAEEVDSVLPRLDARDPQPSQVASAFHPVAGTAWEYGTPLATLSAWQDQLVRPLDDWLRLEATRSVEANLADALGYLGSSAQ